MEQRTIGSTGLQASVLAFGCAPVASRSGSGDSRRALTLAFDSGVTLFDTADMYGVGGSEETLGRVFKGGGRRDQILISSKCGYTFSSRLKALSWVKPLLRPLVTRLKGVKSSASSFMASQRSQNFEPQYIESCVHASLSRLGTDRIDLFFLHDPSIEIAQRPDVFQALARLKQAGKLRCYGVSCDVDVAIKVLRTAGTGVSVVQVNMNVLEQDALSELLPLARGLGIGVIARQPFAHARVFESPEVRSELAAAGLASDPASIASLALRFSRECEGVASVLPSMMRLEHVRANVAAMTAAPLSETERTVVAALRAKSRQPRPA